MRSEKRRAMGPRVIGSSTFQTNVSIFLLKKFCATLKLATL